jgi:hypothetical protein
MRSTTFPHELHAGSSLMFIASSPRNEAIHLQSRSIEMKIKIYSPSAAVHLNVLLPSRETDPRCLVSGVIKARH